MDLEVRLSQGDDLAGHRGVVVRRVAPVSAAAPLAGHARLELRERELVLEVLDHPPHELAGQRQLDELAAEEYLVVAGIRDPSGSVTKRDGRSMETVPVSSMVPVRKVIDDTWPSPTARRLRMKRIQPTGSSDWSG